MKSNIKKIVSYILGASLVIGGVVFAGVLSPSVSTGTPNFVTLEDLYQKTQNFSYSLSSHDVSTSSEVAPSMHTLQDIWDSLSNITLPAESDVRENINYGINNSATGSLVVSNASDSVNDLSDLSISNSPSGYTFAGGTYTYDNVSVSNPVTSITVTPTGNGTIIVNGTTVTSGQASGAISLSVGANIITVLVAESSRVSKTYTINITRGEIASDLTDLVISGSPSNYSFSGSNYTYNGVTVLNAVDSITITPTGSGTITVDGTPVTSGSPSGSIALTAGVEKIILVVVSETNKSDKTYTIKITRNNAGLVWSTEQGGMDWDTASTTCASQGWRLPTIEELTAASLPWNDNGFQDDPGYWSSSEYVSGFAWYADYYNGIVYSSYDIKDLPFYVRCVH